MNAEASGPESTVAPPSAAAPPLSPTGSVPGEPAPPAPFTLRVYLVSAALMAGLLYIFYRILRVVGYAYFRMIIAGLLGVMMVLAGPLLALSIYFATTFAGAIVFPGIPFSINQAVGLGVLVAWGLWMIAGRTSWPGGGYLWLLVLASIYFVINAVLGEDPKAGLEYAKYIALYELLAFVLLTSLRRPAHWTFWFWMILLFTAMNGAVGLLEFVTRLDIFPDGKWTAIPLHPVRVNGLSQNAIMYSYNGLWAFGPGLYLAIQDRVRWRRGVAALITLFVLITALLAFNRQTPVNLFFMLVTAALIMRHRLVRPLTILLIIAAVLASPYAVKKMGERFTHAGEAVKDPSYALRRDKIRIMKEMVRRRPLFGIGLGSFPTVWPKYTPENLWFLSQQKPRINYPDMGYMQMMSESGLLGFALDLIIIGVGGWLVWRRRRAAARTGNVAVINLCGVLAMLLVQLVLKQFLQDVFFFPRTWWVFAMIVVIAAYPDERLVGAATGEAAATSPEPDNATAPAGKETHPAPGTQPA